MGQNLTVELASATSYFLHWLRPSEEAIDYQGTCTACQAALKWVRKQAEEEADGSSPPTALERGGEEEEEYSG